MNNETIALLITTLAPLITSIVRWLIGTHIPRAALPAVAGLAGTGLALIADAGLNTHIGPAIGLALGLASTGLRDAVKIASHEGLAAAEPRDMQV